jgi:outer membrane protein OmpA-like peptidoglycan-associated protein
MARPMLGDVELEQIQLVEADEDQVVNRHPVPGLEGDFLHSIGRRAARLWLAGVLTATDTVKHLGTLREKFHAGEPVGFVSDITSATLIDQVLIERMDVVELAGRPSVFEYRFDLREFLEAEPPPTDDVIIPPPPPPDVENGKLAVTVVVEGDPAFDLDRVRVSVHGTEQKTGADLDRVLTNRTSADVWFEDPFPAGDYTADALVDDTKTPTGQREVLTGSATVHVDEGQVASVTIVLRRGAKIGTVFVIHFHFDKAFVEPCMRHVLQHVVTYAGQHADEKLLIVGHTDLVGPPTHNQALSERRGRATYAMMTFGSDPQKSIAEWNELRKSRPAGTINTVNDTWGTREIQHMLQDLGLYKGNVGNSTGEDATLTDAAIKKFQADHSLAADGIVGDNTWPVLIEAYLGHEPIDLPTAQLMPNKNESGCDSGPLRWLGCSEQDPVKNTEDAWRPNRRTELMFVHESAMPCQVPNPVTIDKVTEGTLGGGWCLNDGAATAVDCFVVPWGKPCPTGSPYPHRPWCRQQAEPGSFTVKGSIHFEDGTPFQGSYVLTAADGEYLDGEVSKTAATTRAGTPISGRTQPDGSFSYTKQKGPGTFSIAVDGPFMLSALQDVEDAKGNAACLRLDGDQDADLVVIDRAVAFVEPTITVPDPPVQEESEPQPPLPGDTVPQLLIRAKPKPRPPRPTVTAKDAVVVVRKSHTNPARRRVVLKVSKPFKGSGTLTVSKPEPIQFFNAVTGGNVVASGTVFTGTQLAAGVAIFAEGVKASDTVGDVVLELSLAVDGKKGRSAIQTMTAVALTLDIAALPNAAGLDRGDLSAAEKASPGRLLQLQTLARQAQRARLTIRPPQPAGFKGRLVLRRLTAGVDMFSTEVAAAADKPIGARFAVPSTSPPADVRVFAQGSVVSTRPRDTGFQLGLANGEADGDRIAITVATVEVIRADNTAFPVTGDDACHMVSKFVTDQDLPNVATFDGPVPAHPDPDTFRIQVRGLPQGTAPFARLQVIRPAPIVGTLVYTRDFLMLESPVGAVRSFRTNSHVRLVSNDVDDAHLAHQTAKVRLADNVFAMVLVGGNRLGTLTLPVGRPPAENGPKAIRTADINFVTATALPTDPVTTVARMSENWAQVAIRFNLVGQRTVVPVRNVLEIDFPEGGRQTAAANGSLTVDITPAGAAAADRVIALVTAGDRDQVIAQKLAAQISKKTGLAATAHRHNDQFLVLVNRGTNVAFANTGTTVAGLVFREPVLDFTNDITLLEGSVLGLNFADQNPSTIDVIVVGNVPLLPPQNLNGAAGGDSVSANLPGWHNVAIIQQAAADGSAPLALVPGHEMGHVLLDGGPEIHSTIATNLMNKSSTPDAIGGSKRLRAEQNTTARTQSGPATVPALLHKR